MKNAISFVFILALVAMSFSVVAQPQYAYNSSSTTGNNIPFNSSTNLRQNLYYPSDFTGAPSGYITTLYIKTSGTVSANYTNLTVKMGPTALGTFSPGPFITGLTTVFNGPATLTSITGNWVVITLSTPYYYNNTQNLIIEFSQTGHSPGFAAVHSGGSVAPDRSLYGQATASTANTQARLLNLGFDIVTCIEPNAIYFNDVISTSATVSWDTVATGSNFEYAITTNVLPPAAGTATMDTFHHATGLDPNTWYYAHVRSDCSSSFSAWATDSFMTTACLPVTPGISNITDNSVVISWTASPGATNYEYAVNQSATPPASGTLVATSPVTETGLTDTTKYYLHFRAICNAGESDWSSVEFTTLKKSTVGINYHAKEGFNVAAFPNPAQGVINITVSGAKTTKAQITLTDLSGRTLKSLVLENSNAVALDVHELKSGVYFIRYQDDTHDQTLKIVRE